jgi:hypothetical protein
MDEMGFRGRIVVLPNFVMIDNYIPDYTSAERSIVYLGRLSKEKGVKIEVVEDPEVVAESSVGNDIKKFTIIKEGDVGRLAASEKADRSWDTGGTIVTRGIPASSLAPDKYPIEMQAAGSFGHALIMQTGELNGSVSKALKFKLESEGVARKFTFRGIYRDLSKEPPPKVGAFGPFFGAPAVPVKPSSPPPFILSSFFTIISLFILTVSGTSLSLRGYTSTAPCFPHLK